MALDAPTPAPYLGDLYRRANDQMRLSDTQAQYGQYFENQKYGLDQRTQQLQNQGIGLDRGDLYNNYNASNALAGNDLARIGIQEGLGRANLAGYRADAGTMAQQLANQLYGYQNQADTARRQNLNQAVGQGAYFGQERMAVNRDIANQLANQTQASQLANQLQQSDLQRTIRGQEADLATLGTKRSDIGVQQDQRTAQLQSDLARNGIQFQLGGLSLDQMQAAFQKRIADLGLQRQVDANRIRTDLESGVTSRVLQALQMYQQALPDLVAVGSQLNGPGIGVGIAGG